MFAIWCAMCTELIYKETVRTVEAVGRTKWKLARQENMYTSYCAISTQYMLITFKPAPASSAHVDSDQCSCQVFQLEEEVPRDSLAFHMPAYFTFQPNHHGIHLKGFDQTARSIWDHSLAPVPGV